MGLLAQANNCRAAKDPELILKGQKMGEKPGPTLVKKFQLGEQVYYVFEDPTRQGTTVNTGSLAPGSAAGQQAEWSSETDRAPFLGIPGAMGTIIPGSRL